MSAKNLDRVTWECWWQCLKKYRWQVIVAYGFSIFTVGGAIFISILFKEFFDIISEFSGVDRGEIRTDLVRIFVLVIGVNILIYPIGMRLQGWALAVFEAKMIRDLQTQCAQVMHEQEEIFFANQFVGSLVAKAGRFVRGAEGLFDMLYFNLWPNTLRIIFSVGILFIYFPSGAWILLSWFVVYLFIVWVLSVRRKPLEIERSKQQTISHGVFADQLTNTSTIRMFTHWEEELKKLSKQVQKEYLARLRTWKYSILKQDFLQSLLMTTLEAGMLWMLFQSWIDGEITTGTIVLTQSILLGIFMNFWDFGDVIKKWFTIFSDAREMAEIFDRTPQVLDISKPEKCKISRGEILFRNVAFSYGETLLFNKLDLQIKPGEHVGLVGHSGEGKTTLTRLLLRFVNVNSGEILIDGQNIANIRQNDLRNKISFVPQDPILFHRSLSENIRYGETRAKAEEILAVAKMAHAHEFIERTEKGYETLVGERGVKLSGGERQRIAIARAMLKNSPILVLDEATSSLDSVSEKKIQSALAKLMKNRTTLVVAHRLSTLKQMDRIIVISAGKIIEQGSLGELLLQKGVFAKLWEEQVCGFLVDV